VPAVCRHAWKVATGWSRAPSLMLRVSRASRRRYVNVLPIDARGTSAPARRQAKPMGAYLTAIGARPTRQTQQRWSSRAGWRVRLRRHTVVARCACSRRCTQCDRLSAGRIAETTRRGPNRRGGSSARVRRCRATRRVWLSVPACPDLLGDAAVAGRDPEGGAATTGRSCRKAVWALLDASGAPLRRRGGGGREGRAHDASDALAPVNRVAPRGP
jgi:hypothetical protein